MKFQNICLLLLALLVSRPISAQHADRIFNRCATMEADSILRAENPDMGSLHDFETWLQEQIRKQAADQRSGTVITIPVIVHVLHNGEAVGTGSNLSQAQINSQIDVLNEDFRRMFGTPGYNTHPDGADVEVEFCLAAVNPSGINLTEPGIDRIDRNTASFIAPPYGINYFNNTVKPATFWDPDAYMNIWTADLSNDLLGFAQFPNNSGLSDLGLFNGNANSDGVVLWYRAFGRVGNLQAPYNGGRSATHEIGHWLGLRHIWGDGACNVDDFCADTPTADGDNTGCPTNAMACGGPIMVENYMDYTNDACMNLFTQCQKTRIRTVLANAPRRNFTNSTACTPSNAPPVPAFTSDLLSVCSGGSVQFFDQSANGPSGWFWSFPGGSPASSTLQNPIVSYNTPGTFSVSLTASNGNGNASTTQTAYITVGSSGPSVFYSEDFEGDISGWEIQNPDNLIGWEIVDVQGTQSGSKAAYVNHYDYISTGQRDGLISPLIDFSSKSSVSLQFDHAHRRFSVNEQDSLIVYVSVDGGQTYPFQVFGDAENGNGNFATNNILAANFAPTTTEDWCFGGTIGTSCLSIDLSPFDGESQVRLYFETYNDYGNNIYLDNIQLIGVCEIVNSREQGFNGLQSVKISPNPTSDHVKLTLDNGENMPLEVQLTNLMGQVLQHWTLRPQNGRIESDLTFSDIPTGTYLLMLRQGQVRYFHKFQVW